SIGDLLGRRRVFITGLAVFTVASLLCALATTPLALNVARSLQGIGGAAMFAVSLALLAQEFRGRDLTRATGIYGATIGASVALGPLVGGALTESLGWESIFLLNLPFGLLVIAATLARVAESRDPHPRRLDWAGLLTFSAALTLLVFGLLRGNAEGWSSPAIVATLTAAAFLIGAFLVVEARAAEPMLPLTLFRNPTFAGVQLAAFAISASMLALFLYITLYLQNILGLSPLAAGARYLPLTLVAFVVARIVGAGLFGGSPRILLTVGLGLVGFGLVLMHGVDAYGSWMTLLPGFLVAGAGLGVVNAVVADAALKVVPPERGGMAAGINDTFRQVGFTIGIALWGALFLDRAEDSIMTNLPPAVGVDAAMARELAEAASSGNLDFAVSAMPPDVREATIRAAREGFVGGFNDILLWGGIVCCVGAFLALILVRDHALRAASGPPLALDPATSPSPPAARAA
ncbi:MAG: MFS transporter, partial [Chloroflexia bacterium]|nr:MFS transporter [Chloroflexia bacterium]